MSVIRVCGGRIKIYLVKLGYVGGSIWKEAGGGIWESMIRLEGPLYLLL